MIVAALSATIALSLPYTISLIAKNLLIYWSLIGNEKIFVIVVELALALLVIFLSNYISTSLRDRKLSNMARRAGLVYVSPTRGLFAWRKTKKLKEQVGFARDVMVIGSTGFRTFVDSKGDLHNVVQDCREAKIMLLNPYSEGASTRAKSILDPNITPENFGDQIRKSINFLKSLKAAQKNVRLKLYQDLPLLKLAIIGDYVWIQHYHTGLDVQTMPEYVFKHDQNTGSLYIPFYQYFLTRWNNTDIPEYDLDADELIYRDEAGNEVKRGKFDEVERREAMSAGSSVHPGSENHHQEEMSSLLLPPFRACVRTQNIFAEPRQALPKDVRFGGKEYFLLKSNRPMCAAIGWMSVF